MTEPTACAHRQQALRQRRRTRGVPANRCVRDNQLALCCVRMAAGSAVTRSLADMRASPCWCRSHAIEGRCAYASRAAGLRRSPQAASRKRRGASGDPRTNMAPQRGSTHQSSPPQRREVFLYSLDPYPQGKKNPACRGVIVACLCVEELFLLLSGTARYPTSSTDSIRVRALLESPSLLPSRGQRRLSCLLYKQRACQRSRRRLRCDMLYLGRGSSVTQCPL
jgi:hypothetical protein